MVIFKVKVDFIDIFSTSHGNGKKQNSFFMELCRKNAFLMKAMNGYEKIQMSLFLCLCAPFIFGYIFDQKR